MRKYHVTLTQDGEEFWQSQLEAGSPLFALVDAIRAVDKYTSDVSPSVEQVLDKECPAELSVDDIGVCHSGNTTVLHTYIYSWWDSMPNDASYHIKAYITDIEAFTGSEGRDDTASATYRKESEIIFRSLRDIHCPVCPPDNDLDIPDLEEHERHAYR